jgi:hypothetical protein
MKLSLPITMGFRFTRIHRAERTCRHIVAFIIKLENDGKFDSQCDLSGVPEQPDLGGDARQLSIAHV